MRWIWLTLSLSLACSGSPLRIAAVDRPGMPPYEGVERAYRIEGEGVERLRLGDRLEIGRPGERRTLGRLEVVRLFDGYAMAHLKESGETYPLVGDFLSRQDLRTLPNLPVPDPNPLPKDHVPRADRLLLPTPYEEARREALFFLPGDASLSPGALRKLQAWVTDWRKDGTWFLLYARDPRHADSLVETRCKAIQDELKRLGVARIEVRMGPWEAGGRYDLVTVGREPR